MTDSSAPASPQPPAQRVSVSRAPGETDSQSIARALNDPALQAATTVQRINSKGDMREVNEATSLNDHHSVTIRRVNQVIAGESAYIEAALISQAQTLDGLFNLMARRAVDCVGVSLDATEKYMRMAMKAQNQCRATLETLAEVKNPRVAVFANQANVTSGPQQVNNGAAVPTRTGTSTPAADERERNNQNELLEADHGQGLDTGAPSQAGRGNQALEAVGKEHRPAHRRRQKGQ